MKQKLEILFGSLFAVFFSVIGNAQNFAKFDTEEVAALYQESYPENIVSISKNLLVMKNGTTHRIQSRRLKHQSLSHFDLLEFGDLFDQVSLIYPKYKSNSSFLPVDSGRIRYEPFFKSIYGQTWNAVQKNLVKVPWQLVGSPIGQSIQVTTIAGVDKALKKVHRALLRLPSHLQKKVSKAHTKAIWRPISGTKRLSMHSFGIAIDFISKNFEYWKWTPKRKKALGFLEAEIVEVFEKYCFVWGGKWQHYDTMHFEFRPELLKGCRKNLEPKA